MAEAKRLEWNVSGMDCASCVAKVTRAVERMPGVSDVSVALMAEKLSLNLVPDTTPTDKIEAEVIDCLRQAGDSPRGFILATGCEVPLHTPPESIGVFMAAGERWGKLPLELPASEPESAV